MAQANYVQQGKSIDYTPVAAVAAGDVVVIGDLLGIAKLDIPAGKLGALATEGVFDVAKITGALTAGQKAYWDADGDPHGGTAGSGALTTVAANNVFIGTIIRDAADTGGYGRVLLGQDLTPVVAHQADSEATTVAGTVADLNTLLANLQAAGLMASA